MEITILFNGACGGIQNAFPLLDQQVMLFVRGLPPLKMLACWDSICHACWQVESRKFWLPFASILRFQISYALVKQENRWLFWNSVVSLVK